MERRYLGGALAAFVAALPAAAQEPDPAAGLQLAEQLCTACHIVGTESVGSDAAPPFATIAADPAITLSDLHAWPGPAHPVLPDLALTEQQIADINAYLDSLRDGAAPTAEPPAGADPGLPEGASPRLETEEPPPAIEQAPPEEIGPPIVPQREEGD